EAVSEDSNFITLYGKLSDKFGDNGVISVVIAKTEESTAHIDLWLMSCRVLKRNMEHAMLDALVLAAKEKGIEKLCGYYYKTAKNNMVRDFYKDFGFTLVSQNGDDTVWELDIKNYEIKNKVIEVEK
ncbi:MAG: haloacid dehalogenase, partial [Clostridia bacterium]|nr:haloacid dehalogenase [Clostridia bacterium]